MHLTDKELLNYSHEHLLYEIKMFTGVSKINTENFSGGDKQFITNVVLESFAIHLRNLINFLYPINPVRDTDVVAKYFFANQDDWGKICPILSKTLEKARTRANKEVGHLTVERIAGTNNLDKAWKIGGLVDEVIPIIKLFSKHADENKLDKDILSYLN